MFSQQDSPSPVQISMDTGEGQGRVPEEQHACAAWHAQKDGLSVQSPWQSQYSVMPGQVTEPCPLARATKQAATRIGVPRDAGRMALHAARPPGREAMAAPRREL